MLQAEVGEDMKKVLKVFGIVLGGIVLVAAGVLAFGKIKEYKALNTPLFPDNYYEGYAAAAGGPLEAKYTGKGSCDVESIVVPSDNRSIKNIRICYPAELKSTDRKYPLVMVVNGSQTPAKIYLPVFERLASWGFIVVGNDDPQTGTGDTASMTLDYVLNESEIKDRVDTENMGITGYSQGGAGALTAVTKHDNGKRYKSIFTGSAAYPYLAKNMGWEYDPAEIRIPYFMTAATGTSDDQGLADINSDFAGVAPLQSLVDIYHAMDENAVKIRARCVGAEHEEMILRTDGYMTAWFLYFLQRDEEAGSALFGEDAEILTNANWQDVEKNQ
jgi:hypothetical protein